MSVFRVFGLSGVLLLAGLPSSVSATTIWTFHDTVLTGQLWDSTTQTVSPITATVTGFFEVEKTVLDEFPFFVFVDWDVDVDSNWFRIDHRYKKGDAGNAAALPALGGSPNNFAFTYWNPGNIYLGVELEENLIDTPGFKEIDLSWLHTFWNIGDGTYTCYSACASLPPQPDYPSSRARIVANGDLAAAPVPEPTTLLLFGTGLAAAGVRRYRQRK